MAYKFRLRGGIPTPATRKITHEIEETFELPRFIADILVRRGYDSVDKANAFLNPSIDRDWLNPYDLHGMQETVDALESAIKEKKHIVVFGDFDLDGISATTVMTRGIRALGGKVTPFIPRRLDEGYGISLAALDRVMELNPDVLITVDCGVSCAAEVDHAIGLGVEVLVTDHHEAGDSVPSDVPLVDPKVQGDTPSTVLAGVGVALKVIHALGSRFGYPYLWRSYTDFATLGTVADLMPMVGENRALVNDGLYLLNNDPRPCIKALRDVCGYADKILTSSNLSFSLIPRLNAAGRMGDAELALSLLMTDSADEAEILAEKLNSVNDMRRSIEAELSEMALEQAEQTFSGERALVVAGEGWHEGVKGIVASRLVNKYGVPALLFTIEGDQARGSGRSVGNVNLFKAVEQASDLLTKFGGHGAAVGVTLPVENIDAFRERLCQYMANLPEIDFKPMIDIDCVVSLDELTLDTVGKIEVLAPFGQENPEPVFLSHGVFLDSCRAVGADKNHLSCQLTDGVGRVSAILFHAPDIDDLVGTDTLIDVAFNAQVDEWRGRYSVKAMLKAVAPTKACIGLNACLDDDSTDFMEGLFDGSHVSCAESEERQLQNERARWQQVAMQDPGAVEAEIIKALIGESKPHEAQRALLEHLKAGNSVLGVMATGRGKSLVFQTYAALSAIAEGKASVFVYPLRALMSDQAFHIAESLSKFGLVCKVLNGETPQDERKQVYDGLKDGMVDIVLTTPEYIFIHAGEIAACNRIGFLVVDEAHHIGQAKAGSRPAYRRMASVIEKLGNPVVLAVSATVPTSVGEDISRELPVGERVIDNSSRDNLHIDDQRGIVGRDDYLAHIISYGEKCVIYVNSREQSVGVARRLRARLPQLAPMIGFYNAGLSRDERSRVESLFRKGEIRTLVATSAFGEGVDVPDIRHVVLYHMPFSHIEFNQMAGRAGRDGGEAIVHLLYGKQDVSINTGILEEIAPNRDVMAQVYRHLRKLQRQFAAQHFTIDPQELAEGASSCMHSVSEQAAECAIAVFRELGLIECVGNAATQYGVGAKRISVRVVDGADKVELTDSVRYREGLEEMASFKLFRDWAMRSDIHSLTVRVTHPISPGIDGII